MALNTRTVQRYAEAALDDILNGVGVNYTSSIDSESGTLTIKLEKSVDLCGYSTLLNFMFMTSGEIYFFALFDKLKLTAENAAIAFDVSSSTPIAIVIAEYLTAQLGAYLFTEENAYEMLQRYFDDLIYLIEQDDSMKKLLDRMEP